MRDGKRHVHLALGVFVQLHGYLDALALDDLILVCTKRHLHRRRRLWLGTTSAIATRVVSCSPRVTLLGNRPKAMTTFSPSSARSSASAVRVNFCCFSLVCKAHRLRHTGVIVLGGPALVRDGKRHTHPALGVFVQLYGYLDALALDDLILVCSSNDTSTAGGVRIFFQLGPCMGDATRVV